MTCLRFGSDEAELEGRERGADEFSSTDEDPADRMVDDERVGSVEGLYKIGAVCWAGRGGLD